MFRLAGAGPMAQPFETAAHYEEISATLSVYPVHEYANPGVLGRPRPDAGKSDPVYIEAVPFDLGRPHGCRALGGCSARLG